MTDDLCEVIITAPDQGWLIDLCRQLVDARLASSAHVVHPVTSIYRWEGAIHETTEARAFLRSRRTLVDHIVSYVTSRHPYEVPNVSAIAIVDGNPAYLLYHIPTCTNQPPVKQDTSSVENSRILSSHPFHASQKATNFENL